METLFTPGPWRVGADLCRVHPNWRDEHGNLAREACHRNGYAKTIATIANEDHDWRDIGAQVADAYLIAAAPELYEAGDELEAAIADGLCNSGLPGFDAERLERARANMRAALRKANPSTPTGEPKP